jgi:predicted acyl esterase
MKAGSTMRTRRPLNTPEFRGARAREYTRTIADRMIIERDVRVPTREGFDIFVDIFRPTDAAPAGTIAVWTPYGKHDPAPLAQLFPKAGVKPEWQSDYTIFEAPDPAYWISAGYAMVVADAPGTWYATTHATYLDRREAAAFYDLIEWSGIQPWSNGRVGLSGVSYLTCSQWQVAALNPPHLAAINPWEGWTDIYNEIVRHGGIPETHFWPYIQMRWGASDTRIEDLWAQTIEHPFYDEYWASKVAPLEQITVPAYIVASWSDHGCHTRGTIEGYRRISSEQKWLEVHGSKKWQYYYEPASVERQRLFFDHFLKGEPNAVQSWPKVVYQLRNRHSSHTVQTAEHWPIENSQYRRLYLHGDHTLQIDAPTGDETVSYDSLDDHGTAVFDYRFDSATAVVGYAKLVLNVSTDRGDDLDLFITVDKLDERGQRVGFTHYQSYEDGPAAFGWLRVSRRELDPARSTEHRPVLANKRDLKLKTGEIAQAHIEILPSGTLFEAGSTLRLTIKGRDIFTRPKPLLYMRHEDSVNLGMHNIHLGGQAASYLSIPIISDNQIEVAA